MTKKRARQRGAATFETIVIFPALVVTLGLSLWAWQLLSTKLGAMRSVREPVYAQALGGCGAGGPTAASLEPPSPDARAENAPELTTPDPSTGLDMPDGVDFSSVSRHIPAGPGAAVLDAAFGGRTGAVVRKVAASALVGGGSYDASGRVQMFCNETVREGDVSAMKKIAANAFDPRSP